MKDFLDAIWNFPADHPALGWWIAAIFTLWNVIASITGRALTQVRIFRREFRKDQMAKRIRNIEHLHDNTYGLVRYLAADFVDVAIDVSIIGISFTILLIRVIHVSGASMIAATGINIATSIIGRAWRLRTLLNDLANFPVSVEILKIKLKKLNS